MSCPFNAGYAVGCFDNLGGTQDFLVRSFSGSVTYSYNALGVITGSTDITTPVYRIEQVAETAELNNAGQHNADNKTNYWEVNANLIFHKYQASLRNLIYMFALQGTEVYAQDQNGRWFLLAEQNPVYLVASAPSVGKAYGDLNGSTISLQSKQPKPMPEVSATYIASLTVINTTAS